MLLHSPAQPSRKKKKKPHNPPKQKEMNAANTKGQRSPIHLKRGFPGVGINYVLAEWENISRPQHTRFAKRPRRARFIPRNDLTPTGAMHGVRHVNFFNHILGHHFS